jgi:hypothetical protein
MVWIVKAGLKDNYKVFLDTLCWDNGVDFAPEYLYEKIIEETKKSA